jgi:hypothetical protein
MCGIVAGGLVPGSCLFKHRIRGFVCHPNRHDAYVFWDAFHCQHSGIIPHCVGFLISEIVVCVPADHPAIGAFYSSVGNIQISAGSLHVVVEIIEIIVIF